MLFGTVAESRAAQALQQQLGKLATQIEAVQIRWQEVRDAQRAAEDACEQQAVLWATRTARTTDRTVRSSVRASPHAGAQVHCQLLPLHGTELKSLSRRRRQ